MEAQLIEVGQAERLELARIEIDTAIATAKQYPRNVGQIVQDSIAMATRNKETAISMRYNLPVGGGQIGNSIRLAEILASTWGNMKLRSVTVDDTSEAVICRARAIDLQTNYEEEVEVRRSLLTKEGRRFQPHVVTSTVNAALKIAKRNVVFAVIPKSVVDEVADAALEYVLDGAKSIEDRRDKALSYFKELEVTVKEILAFLERKAVTDINMADIQNLFGIASAIKSGDTTVDKTFRPKPKPNTATVKPKDVKPKPEAKPYVAATDPASPGTDRTVESFVDRETGEVIPLTTESFLSKEDQAKRMAKSDPSPLADDSEAAEPEEEEEVPGLSPKGIKEMRTRLKIPKKVFDQMVQDVGMGEGTSDAKLDDLSETGRQLLEAAMRDYKG